LTPRPLPSSKSDLTSSGIHARVPAAARATVMSASIPATRTMSVARAIVPRTPRPRRGLRAARSPRSVYASRPSGCPPEYPRSRPARTGRAPSCGWR
jgi:hypothetical protein